MADRRATEKWLSDIVTTAKRALQEYGNGRPEIAAECVARVAELGSNAPKASKSRKKVSADNRRESGGTAREEK